MTLKRQFAQDADALDKRMDELLEVLVQILEERQDPLAQPPEPAIAELLPGPQRGMNVVRKSPR
jgi:hypothetical protein